MFHFLDPSSALRAPSPERRRLFGEKGYHEVVDEELEQSRLRRPSPALSAENSLNQAVDSGTTCYTYLVAVAF